MKGIEESQMQKIFIFLLDNCVYYETIILKSNGKEQYKRLDKK